MNRKFSDLSYDVTKMASAAHGDGCLLTPIIFDYPFFPVCENKVHERLIKTNRD